MLVRIRHQASRPVTSSSRLSARTELKSCGGPPPARQEVPAGQQAGTCREDEWDLLARKFGQPEPSQHLICGGSRRRGVAVRVAGVVLVQNLRVAWDWAVPRFPDS
jgi:hypothetical protein